MTNLYKMRNPERSASATFPADEIWSAESKDPEDASFTMPPQGIPIKSVIPHA
jgi:hypothetical protein